MKLVSSSDRCNATSKGEVAVEEEKEMKVANDMVPESTTAAPMGDNEEVSVTLSEQNLKSVQMQRSPHGNEGGPRWIPKTRKGAIIPALVIQIVFFALFIIALTISLTYRGDDAALTPIYAGSILTLTSSITIFASYGRSSAHPNRLLFFRSLCEFAFAVHAIFRMATANRCTEEYKDCETSTCAVGNSFSQFLILCSEGWYGAAIIDLYWALTNPFTDFRNNQRIYHAFVWTGSLLISITVPVIVYSRLIRDTFDLSAASICNQVHVLHPQFISIDASTDYRSLLHDWRWLNFYYWVLLFIYVFILLIAAQMLIFISWYRSYSGIGSALRARRTIIKNMTLYVEITHGFWLVLLTIFICYLFLGTPSLRVLQSRYPGQFDDEAQTHALEVLFQFLITGKGYFTLIVWYSFNEAFEVPLTRFGQSSTRHQPSTQENLTAVEGYETSEEMETTLPQTNDALRAEVIYYTVTGIKKALKKMSESPSSNTFTRELILKIEESQPSRESTFIYSGDDTINEEPFAYQPDAFESRALCQGTQPVLTSNQVLNEESNNETKESVMDRRMDSHFFHGRNVRRHSAGDSSCYFNVATPPCAHRYSSQVIPHRRRSDDNTPFFVEQDIELQSNSSLCVTPRIPTMQRSATVFRRNTRLDNQDRKPKAFVDFAPREFSRVREAFGISNQIYTEAFQTTTKERLSEGASGAFVFYSGDNSLIVKSMSRRECAKLISIAKAYASYVIENPDTKIVRFYGCHCIKIYGRHFYFIVMANLFHTPLILHEKYDIKGSWVNRRGTIPRPGDMVTCINCNIKYCYPASREDNNAMPCHQPSVLYKDEDLKKSFILPDGLAAHVHHQLVKDSDFLSSLGIMDYSLLVGVHIYGSKDDYHSRKIDDAYVTGREYVQPIGSGKEVYFLGIIDILQEWSLRKRCEHTFKTLFFRQDPHGISAICPEEYKARFQRKMAHLFRTPRDVGR